MLAHCKIVDVSVCASQAAARKAQPLWQQLGYQAKINERKKIDGISSKINFFSYPVYAVFEKSLKNHMFSDYFQIVRF